MSAAMLEELEVVKHKYKEVEGADLEACIPAMVRLKITRNKFKNLVVCFQFPDNYPSDPLIVELKSKVLKYNLLQGLTKMCEEEVKKLLGQHQIMPVLHLIRKFIDDNPLCICSEEIGYIKRELLTKTDEIKLKQKTSQVTVRLQEKDYIISLKATVPDLYPEEQLKVEIEEHNFPETIFTNFRAQTAEITRKAVKPPLKPKPKDPPFEPKPSLKDVVKYLTTHIIRKYPNEKCSLCGENALPESAKDVINDPRKGKYVERNYCSHLFHLKCLNRFMKTPPFEGGKKCPTCKNRIYHERFKTPTEVVEARWAHKEARKRELAEVAEFLE